MTIHWCGTGLSSIPGLRRLIEAGHPVTVWNRTVERAQAEVGDLTQDIREFSLEALGEALEPNDIAVSMLPAEVTTRSFRFWATSTDFNWSASPAFST